MTATGSELRLRWSSARDCSRKAIYQATSAPARERTHREERILARGRAVGQEYVLAVAHESRRKIFVCSGVDFTLPHPDLRTEDRAEAGILAELPVSWELGVGHADAWIRDVNTVVEVVSSQRATGELIRSKLLQGALYAEALQADAVALAIVDPATLEDERVIVARGTERWERIQTEVNERVLELIRWKQTGEMPARVCARPSDSWGHFCLHADHCFQDAPLWEPAVAGEIEDEDAQRLAANLASVKTRRRELSAEDDLLEREQKQIQAELEGLVPPGEWQIGGYRVKRSERSGRRSFDFGRAELDSRVPGTLLEEFTKSGSSYSVWDVERDGDVLVVEDKEAPF